MDWEVINGITGIISAVGAFSGVGYVAFGRNKKEASNSNEPLTLGKLASFSIACSGWALCCLAFLWVMEPYGPYVTDREYQQFFGIIISFPALIVLLFGISLLQSGERNKFSKRDRLNGGPFNP